MKTLLVLLLLTVSALAIEPKGQGPRPDVTSETMPKYIADAIRNRLNDPNSMELVEWTQPVLETTRSGGQEIGWWYMKVTVRARNSKGGLVTANYGVTIKNEQAKATNIR